MIFWSNKGRNGSNHGLFRHLQIFKTVTDCEDSSRLSRNVQSVKIVDDC